MPILQQLVDCPIWPHSHKHPNKSNVLQECFTEMGKAIGGGVKGFFLRQVPSPTFGDFVLTHVVPDPSGTMRALTHNTAVATMVDAGKKVNILAPNAVITVDCRILPGTDPHEFIEEFKERIKGDYEVEPLEGGIGPPVESKYKDNLVFEHCVAVLEEGDPGATCCPWTIQGFTDARAFAEIGIPTFGWSPCWLPPSLPFKDLGFHGHDEHIPLNGFRWGAACVRELVKRVCVEEVTSDGAGNSGGDGGGDGGGAPEENAAPDVLPPTSSSSPVRPSSPELTTLTLTLSKNAHGRIGAQIDEVGGKAVFRGYSEGSANHGVGLLRGDIITSVNGVRAPTQVRALELISKAPSPFKVRVVRSLVANE